MEMFSTWFSIILAVLVLIFNRGLLRLLFGSVENSVMEACITYLRISAYSFPALAIYNAGASLYRSMGKTDVTMYISIISRNDEAYLVLSIVWNLLVFVITPVFMQFYALSDQTKYLIVILVLIHNIFNTVAFPFSGPLSNGLRATGDVKYTMIVSIASTVLGRFIFSIIFAIYFNMGVIGIAFAMCLDWTIRGIIFFARFKSNKWCEFKVI